MKTEPPKLAESPRDRRKFRLLNRALFMNLTPRNVIEGLLQSTQHRLAASHGRTGRERSGLQARFQARTFVVVCVFSPLLLALALLSGCGKQSSPERGPQREAQNAFRVEAKVVVADLERLMRAFYTNDLTTQGKRI